MPDIFDERYNKLNDAQKRAVDTTEGLTLIVDKYGITSLTMYRLVYTLSV